MQLNIDLLTKIQSCLKRKVKPKEKENKLFIKNLNFSQQKSHIAVEKVQVEMSDRKNLVRPPLPAR